MSSGERAGAVALASWPGRWTVNAAARLAGLIAVAAVPLAAGLANLQRLGGTSFVAGFARAMWMCAGLCALGALATFAGGAGPRLRST